MKPRARTILFLCVLLLPGLIPARPAGAVHSTTRVETNREALNAMAQKARRRAEQALVRARDAARRRGWPLRAVGPDGQVYVLQRLDGRGAPVYYVTTNLGAAQTVSTDHLWPSTEPGGTKIGFDLTGGGETVGIWDEGEIASHTEFQSGAFSRVVWEDNTFPGEAPHSTHVAGTLIAEGTDSAAHGMGHAMELRAWDFNGDGGEMSTAGADGMRASNHSYGIFTGWDMAAVCSSGDTWHWYGDPAVSDTEDYRFGFYGPLARERDDIAWHAPRYLIVYAAGNERNDAPPNLGADGHWFFTDGSGQQAACQRSTAVRRPDGEEESISGFATAKNVLAVGAVREIPGGYSSSSDVVAAPFSSFGPTDDGRIKPELVAKGVGTYSTVPGGYGTLSGTSMAAPNVTGSVGLLLELYRSLHGNPPPLASTLRAVLIHTADPAGGHPSPDYSYGWGLLNTRSAAELLRRDDQSDSPLIHEFDVTEGDSVQVDFTVDSPDTPVKVTLAWTDPPGTPPTPASLDPADTMLINNLDLRVVGPDGSTYFPWVPTGDRSNDTALPRGDNDVGVNEQVFIPTPDTGPHTAVVRLSNALPGTQTQAASLVVGAASTRRGSGGTPPPSGGGGGGGGSCLIERTGAPPGLLKGLRRLRDVLLSTRVGRRISQSYYVTPGIRPDARTRR